MDSPDRGQPYLAFTIDYDVDKARERFKERYGCEPDHHFISNNLLMVGPVPKPLSLTKDTRD